MNDELSKEFFKDTILNRLKLIGKNCWFSECVDCELKSLYNASDATQRWIPYAICMECSEVNDGGRPCFKFINSLYELKEHGKRSHDGKIPKGSMINVDIRGYRVVQQQAKTHYILKSKSDAGGMKTLPMDTHSRKISIEGWNSVSAVITINLAFMKYLLADK